jgi:hypothetical protein
LVPPDTQLLKTAEPSHTITLSLELVAMMLAIKEGWRMFRQATTGCVTFTFMGCCSRRNGKVKPANLCRQTSSAASAATTGNRTTQLVSAALDALCLRNV